MKIPKFKIRASAAGKIMPDGKNSGGLTDKQKIKLKELQDKEKRTPNQTETMEGLIEKRDKPPELSEGAKTYCREWLREILLKRRSDIRSKYTDKGNLVEDESIDFISVRDFFEAGHYEKNEKFFENEFTQGTPDLITDTEVWDMKNSWDHDTFPLLDDKVPKSDYYYQLQVYMGLTERKKAKLIYTLMDTPDHLIEREIKFTMTYSNKTEDEIRKHFYDTMRFTDIPEKLRYKEFSIEYHEPTLLKLHSKVKLCREYIEGLVNKLKEEGKISC